MSDTKPMTLVTSNWNGQTTFRLIPISLEAAFSEGIYDPSDKVLVLMSKHVKESVHLIPRLDDNGDPVPLKNLDQMVRTTKSKGLLSKHIPSIM